MAERDDLSFLPDDVAAEIREREDEMFADLERHLDAHLKRLEQDDAVPEE